jgi:hypothetical protein
MFSELCQIRVGGRRRRVRGGESGRERKWGWGGNGVSLLSTQPSLTQHPHTYILSLLLLHSHPLTNTFYTYWHFGRKPASMVAPDTPRHLLPKSASVMRVCMVTGLLDTSLPLKVIFKSAKLCAIMAKVQVVQETHRSGLQDVTAISVQRCLSNTITLLMLSERSE